MNTQTAGVWVNASERLPEPGSIVNGRVISLGNKSVSLTFIKGEFHNSYSPDVYQRDNVFWLDESIPTLTIQQALEVWDACDKHIEEVQQYPYGTRSGKYKNPDKHTYFLNKFGFDIDKM